jgi:hypothetical protein
MSGGQRSGRRSRCRHCKWPVEEFDGVGWLHAPYPWLGVDSDTDGDTDEDTDEPAWCGTPQPGAVIQPPADHEPPPWR